MHQFWRIYRGNNFLSVIAPFALNYSKDFWRWALFIHSLTHKLLLLLSCVFISCTLIFLYESYLHICQIKFSVQYFMLILGYLSQTVSLLIDLCWSIHLVKMILAISFLNGKENKDTIYSFGYLLDVCVSFSFLERVWNTQTTGKKHGDIMWHSEPTHWNDRVVFREPRIASLPEGKGKLSYSHCQQGWPPVGPR